MLLSKKQLKQMGFDNRGTRWELQIDPPGVHNGAMFLYAQNNLSLVASDGGDGGTVVDRIESLEAFERLKSAILFANEQAARVT